MVMVVVMLVVVVVIGRPRSPAPGPGIIVGRRTIAPGPTIAGAVMVMMMVVVVVVSGISVRDPVLRLNQVSGSGLRTSEVGRVQPLLRIGHELQKVGVAGRRRYRVRFGGGSEATTCDDGHRRYSG